ncbi:hypothetical protein C0J52_14083 [Blattella germanica]|nr:hypothetical protein C0J52_14083 [Blattella germanica]
MRVLDSITLCGEDHVLCASDVSGQVLTWLMSWCEAPATRFHLQTVAGCIHMESTGSHQGLSSAEILLMDCSIPVYEDYLEYLLHTMDHKSDVGFMSRLRWAGHLMRMKEEAIRRRMITQQLDGQRGRGTPRLRWIDGINGDAVALGMRNWKAKAMDRDRWKKLLVAAQARHNRLRCRDHRNNVHMGIESSSEEEEEEDDGEGQEEQSLISLMIKGSFLLGKSLRSSLSVDWHLKEDVKFAVQDSIIT